MLEIALNNKIIDPVMELFRLVWLQIKELNTQKTYRKSQEFVNNCYIAFNYCINKMFNVLFIVSVQRNHLAFLQI